MYSVLRLQSLWRTYRVIIRSQLSILSSIWDNADKGRIRNEAAKMVQFEKIRSERDNKLIRIENRSRK